MSDFVKDSVKGSMTQAQAEQLLAECRRKIDGMDHDLRDRLNQRAAIIEDVVRAKEILSMPIYEQKREEEVARKVAAGNSGPLSDAALQRIFQAIMTEMRQLQQVYLEKQGKS